MLLISTTTFVMFWRSNPDADADMDGEGDLGRRRQHQRNSGRPSRLGSERHKTIRHIVLHRRVFAQRVSSRGAGVSLRAPRPVVQRSWIQEHLSHISASQYAQTVPPRAGSGVARIDPLRFLAGCRTRRLNQALSVLSLSLGFFWCMCCAVN